MQITQLFWNVLGFELFMTAFQHSDDGSGSSRRGRARRQRPPTDPNDPNAVQEVDFSEGMGAISPVSAFTQGVLASMATLVIVIIGTPP